RPGRIRTHVLPMLIWMAAVVCVVVLFRHRAQRFEVLGLAQGQSHQAAATCDGRLRNVSVQLFERVLKGQPLVVIDTVLDNENLQAQLDTALVEVQHLRAQVVATQQRLVAEAANRQTDWAATHRRFSVDVENTKLLVLELMTLIETDRIALEGLELDSKVSVIQSISDQNDVAFLRRQRVKATYNTLAKKIEENKHLLKQARVDLDAAQRRLAEFSQQQPQHPSVASELDVIHKEIMVQEQRIEELRARREPLVLKSPFDGIVSQLYHRPGEAVLAGDPILTIAEAKPTEVIAFASEDQLGRVRERMPVELIKTADPARVVRSQVAHLGANVELMPQQLWRNPNVPQWGRPVLIKVPPGLELVPGEFVGIRGL
ncbi:MAG: HlyD family secretion protein, partial [Planctomycetota bacterium]